MINRCMTLLSDELRAEGIRDPLVADFTFAALWDDLARLAGETPPAAVRCLHEDGLPLCEPVDRGRALPGAAVPTPLATASS